MRGHKKGAAVSSKLIHLPLVVFFKLSPGREDCVAYFLGVGTRPDLSRNDSDPADPPGEVESPVFLVSSCNPFAWIG